MPANSRWDLIRRLRVNNISFTSIEIVINYTIISQINPTPSPWIPHGQGYVITAVYKCIPRSFTQAVLAKLYIYIYTHIYTFFFLWRCDPTRVMASSFLRFPRSHTQRRTTVRRTPLDEWSARRRDLYLTTHNTHNKYPCPRWDSNTQSQQANGRAV